jgi:hypothetical protein
MYAGLDYGTLVYEGFLPAAPQVAEGKVVKSNVIEIEDFDGRLGCGVPSFFITSRCAGTLSCVLDDAVTRARWTRKLDEVSDAEVTIQLSGDATLACCQCLAETEPWCHELHIWRNGEEVWVGPIQEIEYTSDNIVVRAKDSLAWLGVRVPPFNVNRTSVDTELTVVAEDILLLGFGADSPDHTCEYDSRYVVPTGRLEKRYYEAYSMTALDMLQDMAETGINYTTLGRTIVIVGDSDPLTPLVILTDEHIMGEVEVTKDGTVQGNVFYVHYEKNEGLPAQAEAVEKYCYHDIERIRTGLPNLASAEAVAEALAKEAAITPRALIVPAGSRLSPDTPWTINEMVPGARVDVAITRLCLTLTQSFRLMEIEVNYDPRDGESVGLTLMPMNSVATF